MTQEYNFKLYVAGHNLSSQKAIANLYQIFDQYLNNQYMLKLIDVFEQPLKAEEENIIVTPTLIKELPIPLRRIVGDLSNKEQVLRALRI